MHASTLKGKMIKDYTLNETIAFYGEESEVVHAFKNEQTPVTVYAIRQQAINAETFIPYNNEMGANPHVIYPLYFEIVKSQNFIYMVFEDLSLPAADLHSVDSIGRILKSMQRILMVVRNKLNKHQIFMKRDGSYKLCYLPPYSSFQNKTSNLYSKFHNKSVFAQLFCQMVPVSNKNECLNRLIDNFESPNLLDLIQQFLPSQVQKKSNIKSKAHIIIQQANDEYPDIDDEEFEKLVAEVHVNNSLKHQAEEAFMRQTLRAKQNQQENKEIKSIFDNVKNTMFDVKVIHEKGKSKFQIKMNERKEEESEFQIYYEAYTSIFKLFKKTIRSYLTLYKKGFAGLIAVYLLTVIGAMRKIYLICDLQARNDIFNIGAYATKMNFTKQKNELKKELVKEAKIIATLKDRIQNSTMPFKTFETLMPYLEDDLQLIDPVEIEKFCFFYMTTLLKMKNFQSYHEILVLETMYILLNSNSYEIVYSEDDLPNKWDEEYYQLKKTLISAMLPTWSL